MAGEKVTEIPKLLKDAANRQYLPNDKLGAGGFATCWKTRMIDRREIPEAEDCALKAVRAVLPRNIAWRFKLELAIQSKLHHPNVVELYRAFTCEDVTYVALELCPHGSLTDMIRKRKYLTMGEIRRILIQLCGAVKYLHERDVVHRDIKAGNIFLDEQMNVKLGDFGLAAIMEPGDLSEYARRTTFCGTPNYLAPEILSRENGHGISVDIWAIGVLAYFLAVGKAPFHAKSKEEIYERLRKGDYSWPELAPEQNEIPEDLRNLVASLLVEESRRPSPDQIVRHPFFTCGFIPSHVDPLCKTRRPRFARIGTAQENAKTYEALCRSSRVGLVDGVGTLNGRKKKSKSVAIALAEECARGVRLTIPLKEGVVYLGRRSPVSRQIFEDKDEVLPESNFKPSQIGVLTERVANRGTKVPKHDHRKLDGAVLEICADQEVIVPPPLAVVHGKQSSGGEQKERHGKGTEEKGEETIVFVTKKPASSQFKSLEPKNKDPVVPLQDGNVQKLVQTARAKSRTDKPASYRLKIEPKAALEVAGMLGPSNTTSNVKSPAENENLPAIVHRQPISDLPRSPLAVSQALHANLGRAKSQMIKNTNTPQSPTKERRQVNSLAATSSSNKLEHKHSALIKDPAIPLAPHSAILTAGYADEKVGSSSRPASHDVLVSAIPRETTRPGRLTTTITTTTTSSHFHPTTSQPQPQTQSQPRSQPQPQTHSPPLDQPLASHRQRPQSSTFAAAAAVAAAAMQCKPIHPSSPNRQQQQEQQQQQPAPQHPIMTFALRRARTVTARDRPNSLYNTIPPAQHHLPMDEMDKPTNQPYTTNTTKVPTTLPIRAKSLRLRRTMRTTSSHHADDAAVAAEVEREIVERLKGRLTSVPTPPTIVTSAPTTDGRDANVDLQNAGQVQNEGNETITARTMRRARTLRALRIISTTTTASDVPAASTAGTGAATLTSRPRRRGVNYGGGGSGDGVAALAGAF